MPRESRWTAVGLGLTINRAVPLATEIQGHERHHDLGEALGTSSLSLSLHVTVADAPADRVAAWVLNATLTVPWTANLQNAHPGAFLQVQKILAVDVMFQRCDRMADMKLIRP